MKRLSGFIFFIVTVSMAFSITVAQPPAKEITKMRISVIVVKEKQEAERIMQQLEDGENFSELAKRFSIGPSKEEGGDLGYFAPGEMQKELDDHAVELEVTKYSTPIKVGDNYFILQKTEERNFPVAEPTEKDQEPILFFALSEKPEIIHAEPPDYPADAKKKRIEGRVVVKLLVDTEGNVEKVEIVKGHSMLNDAAIAAARKWKFKPGRHKGTLVKVWMNVPIDFKLKK